VADERPDKRFDVFGVVTEGPLGAPMLHEAEAPMTDYERAVERLKGMVKDGSAIRGCVVRLVPVYGNEAVLADMGACHHQGELPF
jgi:hypothetical protein